MKLHLRLVNVCGKPYRVVSLRPGTKASFSTNYFHDTWHILSDRHGARLLARLMWGLSYQVKSRTIILICGEHLKPTPFGAEPSDPILLALSTDGESTQAELRHLKNSLKRLGPSHGTVRWHTFSLDLALNSATKPRYFGCRQDGRGYQWISYGDNKPLWRAEQMRRRGGFVCYAAPALVMRQRALIVAQLNPSRYGMDYHYLADNNDGQGADGEVQVFSDYHQRRSAAEEARRDVLAQGQAFSEPESLYAVVAARRDQILRHRRARRSRSRIDTQHSDSN